MQQIAIQENLLDLDERTFLLEEVKRIPRWEYRGNKFWDYRVVSLNTLKEKTQCPESIEELNKEIFYRIRNLIRNYYNVNQVYVDTMDLVKWKEGMSQPPHVDEIPHAWRKWGCIIYLNDDFEGGETFYPNFNLTVTPKAGMAVVHLGNQEHLHGVTEVKQNTRYTISSFWGTEADKAILFTKNWV